MPRAAILVLSWTVFVGILQFMISTLVLLLLLSEDVLQFIKLPSAIVVFYASFALVYIRILSFKWLLRRCVLWTF